MRNRILILSILAVVSVACTGKKEAKASKTATTKADVSKEQALEAYRNKKKAAAESGSETQEDNRTLPKKPAAPKSAVADADSGTSKKVITVELLPDGSVAKVGGSNSSKSVLVDPASGSTSSSSSNSSATELAKRMLRQNAGFDPDSPIRVETSVTRTEITTTSTPVNSSTRLSDFDKMIGRYQVAQKVSSSDAKEAVAAEGFEVEILADYTLHVYAKTAGSDCEANIVFRVVRADGQSLSLDLQSYEPSVQNGTACDPIKVFLPETNTDKNVGYKRASNAIFLEHDGGYIPLVAK